MTDYFARLEQPRRPWLDPGALKQKYHDLARQTQPDETVNQAYRVLSDPKLRLQHLLALAGAAPPDSLAPVPSELADLFMQLAPILHRTGTGANVENVANRVREMMEQALADLRALDSTWPKDPTPVLPEVESLHRRLTYLSRWENLLREHALAETGA